jgi:ABC-type multidrug transport system ATPase subunit
MRRRLDIASSLLTRLRVLFLDEPTTGLDPRSRRSGCLMLSDIQGTAHAIRLMCRTDEPEPVPETSGFG